jgi:hypothetical protein
VVVMVQQGGQGGRVPAGVAAQLTRFFAAQERAAAGARTRARGAD